MADSNITKRALSAAMKELMEEEPFQKITVAGICERCDMNRKSFYYHFKDKYDLVNWIFDNEFIAIVRRNADGDPWETLLQLSRHMNANQSFYRSALSYQGQNSLLEHIHEVAGPVLENYLKTIMGNENITQFQIDFYTDALLLALIRWLKNPEPIPPEQFVDLLKSCVIQIPAIAQIPS